MKLIYTGFIIFSISLLCACTPQANDEEWVSLFNGKDLQDWVVKIHHHDVGVNYGNTFRVEDGIIKARYDQYGESFDDQFGHLYYQTPFSSFHLKMEYKFSGSLYPGAPDYTILNSGVMFHSQDPRSIPKEQNWPISVEMQFLAGLGDGEPRPTGNMCSPGTEIHYQGEMFAEHCLNSSSPTMAADKWVSAELIVHGDSKVQHIINGNVVLEYTKPQMGGGVVDGFDPEIFKPGMPLTQGYIALQSEGHPVEFRNIYIKVLQD